MRKRLEEAEAQAAAAEQAVAEAGRLREEVQRAEARHQQLLATSRRDASAVAANSAASDRERDLLQQEASPSLIFCGLCMLQRLTA